jgi:hypothetical protein
LLLDVFLSFFFRDLDRHRNTWRIQVAAEALRRSLAQEEEEEGKGGGRGGGRVRVHMLDVFSASAALHFSAHKVNDPVHFTQQFYHW